VLVSCAHQNMASATVKMFANVEGYLTRLILIDEDRLTVVEIHRKRSQAMRDVVHPFYFERKWTPRGSPRTVSLASFSVALGTKMLVRLEIIRPMNAG